MRVFFMLLMAAGSASAQAPGLQYKLDCEGSDIVVYVKANTPGIYAFKVPHDVCGVSI